MAEPGVIPLLSPSHPPGVESDRIDRALEGMRAFVASCTDRFLEQLAGERREREIALADFRREISDLKGSGSIGDALAAAEIRQEMHSLSEQQNLQAKAVGEVHRVHTELAKRVSEFDTIIEQDLAVLKQRIHGMNSPPPEVVPEEVASMRSHLDAIRGEISELRARADQIVAGDSARAAKLADDLRDANRKWFTEVTVLQKDISDMKSGGTCNSQTGNLFPGGTITAGATASHDSADLQLLRSQLTSLAQEVANAKEERVLELSGVLNRAEALAGSSTSMSSEFAAATGRLSGELTMARSETGKAMASANEALLLGDRIMGELRTERQTRRTEISDLRIEMLQRANHATYNFGRSEAEKVKIEGETQLTSQTIQLDSVRCSDPGFHEDLRMATHVENNVPLAGLAPSLGLARTLPTIGVTSRLEERVALAQSEVESAQDRLAKTRFAPNPEFIAAQPREWETALDEVRRSGGRSSSVPAANRASSMPTSERHDLQALSVQMTQPTKATGDTIELSQRAASAAVDRPQLALSAAVDPPQRTMIAAPDPFRQAVTATDPSQATCCAVDPPPRAMSAAVDPLRASSAAVVPLRAMSAAVEPPTRAAVDHHRGRGDVLLRSVVSPPAVSPSASIGPMSLPVSGFQFRTPVSSRPSSVAVAVTNSLAASPLLIASHFERSENDQPALAVPSPVLAAKMPQPRRPSMPVELSEGAWTAGPEAAVNRTAGGAAGAGAGAGAGIGVASSAGGSAHSAGPLAGLGGGPLRRQAEHSHSPVRARYEASPLRPAATPHQSQRMPLGVAPDWVFPGHLAGQSPREAQPSQPSSQQPAHPRSFSPVNATRAPPSNMDTVYTAQSQVMAATQMKPWSCRMGPLGAGQTPPA